LGLLRELRSHVSLHYAQKPVVVETFLGILETRMRVFPVLEDVLKQEQKFTTRDSGERREFATGSVRDSRKGKGRYDLIPAYPQQRLAQLYERGAEKYADNNWQKGQPLSGYMESAERHLYNFKDGDLVEDHLAAIVWNVYAFMWTQREIAAGRLPQELDDWTTGPDRQKSKPPQEAK
jgi:hypothetical protein